MIRNALGDAAVNAGGYVTLRDEIQGQLMGFDLAPATVLATKKDYRRIERFLDFSEGPRRNIQVFSGLGVDLLREAQFSAFAVLDEFGGMELLIPEFKEELLKLLASPVPCIGVVKTRKAAAALEKRMHLDKHYLASYHELLSQLLEDSDTMILETTGRCDDIAREMVLAWTEKYARK